jgi:hypothetical protein
MIIEAIFLSNKAERFKNEIWEVGTRLTSIMDRMRKALKNNDNLIMKRALRSLVSAQGRLLQAYFSLDSSYKVPPDARESWDHFLAKNQIVNQLNPSIDPSDISSELGIGSVRFDVIVKIDGEYVVVEAETCAPDCVKKMEKIKETVNLFNSGELDRSIEVLDDEDTKKVLLGIKRQLQAKKPWRVIFAVTSEPNPSTLENIKKAGDFLACPEVYYVNPVPKEGSFEVSPNLLQNVGLAQAST